MVTWTEALVLISNPFTHIITKDISLNTTKIIQDAQHKVGTSIDLPRHDKKSAELEHEDLRDLNQS